MRPISYSLILLSFLLLNCDLKQAKEANFINGVETGPTPWTHDIEDEGADFTFAIISDLNGGEREGVFNVAVQQVNRFDPRFVLSIGDLIDGGTEDEVQLKKEWDHFEKRAANFKMPFFHLGGNHDLTNPKMRKIWSERFGPRFYHFIYKNVLFIMVDSEDFEEERMMQIYKARAKALKIIKGEIEGNYEDSEYYHMAERKTGAMSDAQFDYFKNVIEQYPEVKWTFVLMHKPVWQREDEKGLGRLEKLLSDRKYTFINGHLHSMAHRERNNMDYITLGTTGGGQNKDDPNSFDHITLVKMTADKPVITHLRMDGILNEKGHIPLQGDTLSFQAYRP